MKHCYLNNIFTVTSVWKILLMQITHMQKELAKIWKKKFGECHDLYGQSDTSLLADVFENFRNMCLKKYELDPAKFLSNTGLDLQTFLKKTKVKLGLSTDIDMLLMVEKVIRGGICHSIYQYSRANTATNT